MYFLSLIYLFILWKFQNETSQRQKLILGAIPFVMILLLRFGFGADYFSYGQIYASMDASDISFSLNQYATTETFFKVYNLLFKMTGLSYHLFITFTSLCIFSGIYTIIYFKSKSFELSLLLYYSTFFFVWNMSSVRQGIAILMFCIWFFYKDRSNKIINLIILIIGYFFHNSIIFPIFIYYLSKIKWEKKYLIWALSLGIIVSFLPLGPIISNFTFIPFYDRIMFYLESAPKFINFATFIRIVFSTLLILFYNKIDEDSEDELRLYNFVILSLISYTYISFSPLIAARLSIYGYFLTIILAPQILQSFKIDSKTKYRIATIFISSFIVVSFTKEFRSMMLESRYTGTILEANVSTVLNKDYKSFDNVFALSQHISEETKVDSKLLTSILNNQIPSSEYNNENTHLSVKFPNNLYGVINNKGEVVKEPTDLRRMKIYGNIKQVLFSTDGFETIKYEFLDKEGPAYFNHFIDYINEYNTKEMFYQDYWYVKENFDINDYSDSFFNSFNMSVFTNFVKHTSEYNKEISYLSFSNVLDKKIVIYDNTMKKVLVSKFYDSITPLNTSNIIVGKYGNYVDYINLQGEVIWIEKIK